MASDLYNEIFSDGKAEGEARGEARGRAEGEARGRAEGEAKSILAVLAARGIPVSDAVRERVLGCTDIATLDVWVRRAAVATTAAAVVRAKPPVHAPARRPARRARKT